MSKYYSVEDDGSLALVDEDRLHIDTRYPENIDVYRERDRRWRENMESKQRQEAQYKTVAEKLPSGARRTASRSKMDRYVGSPSPFKNGQAIEYQREQPKPHRIDPSMYEYTDEEEAEGVKSGMPASAYEYTDEEPKRDFNKIVEEARQGDPKAEQVVQATYRMMGGEGRLVFKDDKAFQVDGEGNAVEINIGEYVDMANNTISVADRLSSILSKKGDTWIKGVRDRSKFEQNGPQKSLNLPMNDGEVDYEVGVDEEPYPLMAGPRRPIERKQAIQTETSPQAQQQSSQPRQAPPPNQGSTAPQRQSSSSSGYSRSAIPTGAYPRGQFDELHPEEQRILHRTMAIDAALTADAGNLNKLLNGPYDRAAAIAEMDRDRAYSQYLRSKPAGGSGTLKPNEEYEYNDDYNTVLVKNKETGERLYAKDPEGNPMPIQFFNNPEGFRQLMERTYKQAGLKGNQQLKWSPNVRGNFVVIDPQRGVAPLADFVQANANGNLGTAKTK